MKYILAIALSFGLASQASAQRTLVVPEGATINISNESGNISVYGGPRRDVEVGRGNRDMERELEMDSRGSQVNVKVSTQQLVIRVPAGAKLVIENQSGSVSVEGVRGQVEVSTQSGSITVRGVVESLHAETLSGSITADGGSARTYAESISGHVELYRVSGTVDARSTSGSVNVNGRDVSDAKLSSVSGSASYHGTITSDGRLELDSSSGSVEIAVPNNFSAQYDLSSINGHISNEFGPRPVQHRNGDGAELRFSTGSGARIIGTTVSGTVHLEAF